MSKRTNKPISITLSPASAEAIEICQEQWQESKVSRVVDKLIKKAMEGQGYEQIPNPPQKDSKMIKNKAAITVDIIHRGNARKQYFHEGQCFVQAPKKGTYIIRVTNHSPKRKLVVISVDGRNIMDGESAGYDGSGYVLYPYQTWNIKGWRRTADEVAEFEFVTEEKSYDVKMGGDGSNIGTIGVAVFDEKELAYWKPVFPYTTLIPPYTLPRKTWVVPDEDYRFAIGDTSCNDSSGIRICANNTQTLGSNSKGIRNLTEQSAEVSETSEVVGTGYGKKAEMKTTTVTFERATSEPAAIITLRYASKSQLKKWGVLKDSRIPKVNPFPAEKISVPAPPGWEG